MSESAFRCPKCSCPLDPVHLPEDVLIESCPHCFGAYYDRSELAILVELAGARDTAYPCPKCAGPLQTGRYRGELELEQCPRCHGLWFDSGEIGKLRKLSGVEAVLKPGQPGEKAPEAPLMAPAAMAAFVDRLETQRQQAKAAEKEKADQSYSGPIHVPDGAHQKNPDEYGSPKVTHQGRVYEHFQTSWPVVTYVVGEFPWKVKVGETATARDFVHPPYLLSQEVSGKDSVWSVGQHLEPSEVAEAFKLGDALPARSGVGPAQPNPYHEAHLASSKTFWTLVILAVGLAAALAFLARNEPAYEKSFGFIYAAPEKSLVTDPFELKGRTSNVEVELNTNLSNQWAYFSMALVNTDTDVAFDFGRDVSYYHGTEDGEGWSEGSQRDTVYLPQIPAGNYYLRIEPETDSGQFQYTVKIKRDVPRFSFLVLALLLLTLPVGILWLLHRSFESKRWQESDHPWVTYEGGDDDE